MSDERSANVPRVAELGKGIWIVERPQRFYGLEVGTRMTVIRLADGSLLLHSPVQLDGELRRELDAIGPVRFAVAPNRVHHLYAGDVAKVYPAARLWVAPGLERKRPDLVFVAVLGDEAPAEWKDEVEQVFFHTKRTTFGSGRMAHVVTRVCRTVNAARRGVARSAGARVSCPRPARPGCG